MKTTTTIKDIATIQKEVAANLSDLATSAKFQNFLILTNEVEATWKLIKAEMIAHNVKKLDGDWGRINIVEQPVLKAVEVLQPRFYKKVMDVKKVRGYEALKGSLPAGVEQRLVNKLVKVIKVGK
jgi:hypothetical protein